MLSTGATGPTGSTGPIGPVVFLADEPPVLVDWLPWNHTFGGNHNFGMVVFHGGTLYIDDGKPTPALIGETLRNLREIAPTVYFNVPTGFEAIANAMKTDDALRKTLLSRVQMFFYAGAALAQPVWDSLYESQEREIGERIVMTTGLGMTESDLRVANARLQSGGEVTPYTARHMGLFVVGRLAARRLPEAPRAATGSPGVPRATRIPRRAQKQSGRSTARIRGRPTKSPRPAPSGRHGGVWLRLG